MECEKYKGTGRKNEIEWLRTALKEYGDARVEEVLETIIHELPESDILAAQTKEHSDFQKGANWALTHTHAMLRRKFTALSKKKEELLGKTKEV